MQMNERWIEGGREDGEDCKELGRVERHVANLSEKSLFLDKKNKKIKRCSNCKLFFLIRDMQMFHIWVNKRLTGSFKKEQMIKNAENALPIIIQLQILAPLLPLN